MSFSPMRNVANCIFIFSNAMIALKNCSNSVGKLAFCEVIPIFGNRFKNFSRNTAMMM